MPKCTINGKEVEVKEGTSIIEAMSQSGDRIAHYCWHPGLSVAGVCRLCMVEIEGNPRVQIACNTMVTEGMKINNTSEKVRDAVKWGLDFHLINHPLDCPICDQAGECGLQDQYMEYGKYDPEMAERNGAEIFRFDESRPVHHCHAERIDESGVEQRVDDQLQLRAQQSRVAAFRDQAAAGKKGAHFPGLTPRSNGNDR